MSDTANLVDDEPQAAQHICQQTGEHYYASESVPGGLIRWIRRCMTCGHYDSKDLNEQIETYVHQQQQKAVREALKVLEDRLLDNAIALENEDTAVKWDVIQAELNRLDNQPSGSEGER